MKIEIKLPEQKINPKELESRKRRVLKEDIDKKGGLLSKCLVFIKLYGPLSITDLQSRLFKYYKKNIERVNVFRACDDLEKWELIAKVTFGDLMVMPDTEKKKVHKHAEAKHRAFLQKISPQFRGKYNNRNYVWILNGEGEKYLKWACRLNGFEYKEK